MAVLSASQRCLSTTRVLILLVCLSASLAFAQQTLKDVPWVERPVGQGVVWKHYHFDHLFGAKQSVSFIEADLNNPEVKVRLPYLPASRKRTSALVPEQVPQAVAAINGTYFDITSAGGHTVYLRVNNQAIPQKPSRMGRWSWEGALVQDQQGKWAIVGIPAGGWASDTRHRDIMSNGPVLIAGGKIRSGALKAVGPHCTLRHPRSAVGITVQNKLVLFAVDGRTSEAAGMSCEELAQAMLQLGCVDALNLDGGGSTTLWVRGQPDHGVVSYPSDNKAYDHKGERPVSNAIAVISKPVGRSGDRTKRKRGAAKKAAPPSANQTPSLAR